MDPAGVAGLLQDDAAQALLVQVGTEDGGLGLGNVEKELLFLGDSAEAASGAWSATAGLQLKVGADVEPGSYASVVTLSLFE